VLWLLMWLRLWLLMWLVLLWQLPWWLLLWLLPCWLLQWLMLPHLLLLWIWLSLLTGWQQNTLLLHLGWCVLWCHVNISSIVTGWCGAHLKQWVQPLVQHWVLYYHWLSCCLLCINASGRVCSTALACRAWQRSQLHAATHTKS